MWCKALGIKSPKEEGITGLEIGSLFKDKRYMEIAEYCLRDLEATRALYLIWEKYINTA